MATLSPRRTERMVVPGNWGSSWVIGRALARSGDYLPPKSPQFKRGFSGALAADEDGVTVDAQRLQQRGVDLVQVGEDHPLAGELDRLDGVEEGRGIGELDAQHAAHVHDDLRP